MISKVKILLIRVLSIFAMSLFGTPRLTVGENQQMEPFNKGLEHFGIHLFSELAKTHPNKNIVFSPFSIQTCIAMARMGAEGVTAHEMDQVMALSDQNPIDIAQKYHTILALYENSSSLKIANKIYMMQGFEIQPEFNKLLTEKFFSKVDSLNFANSAAAAATINSWVESKTNNLIKDLIKPTVLSSDTRMVLVNAIHFKGDWVHQFPERSTREMDFYLDETKTIKVQMMNMKENFKFGEFPELDATALEMPYKNSDLCMLIILPNSPTGLIDLENKLQNVSLPDLTQRMFSTKIIVSLPKFKAEFEAELSDPLIKMGMKRMFTPTAEFGKMLESKESLQVSAVIHKAFIEVNERGTEAAAATGMAIRKKRSLIDSSQIKEFNIEHPFMFKILHKPASEAENSASNLILFAGEIKNIDKIILPTGANVNEIKDEL